MKYRHLRAVVDGGFWGAYQRLVRKEVLSYQWRALNDQVPGAPPSHSVENFRIAAGLSTGEYDGMVFQDSDLAKWLEAAGHALADDSASSTQLAAWVEEAVDLVASAQQPDGYLNTYFTIKEPAQRWKNLREAHELYCAGHFIEAGVSVYRSTKNEKILTVVRRLADLIDSRFGGTEGKMKGYPGHQEIELALVKLYRLTEEPRYLRLAEYFVNERGRDPNYFEQESVRDDVKPIFGILSLEYNQAHTPVVEQNDAVGHAVRAMYLYVAMADLAFETGNTTLEEACDRLWDSAVNRRMYVTGGVGSSARKESFTTDFDLPNGTAYAETCAAIGLFLFAHRMTLLHNDARYVDVMERTLYNGILSGLSLDGHEYFYVNPLEVVPSLCENNPIFEHVRYRRQPWYGCSCCPPNIARLIASLGEYAYHTEGQTLYVDLFHSGTISCQVGATPVSVRQRTDYPWDEKVELTIGLEQAGEFTLAVRVPEWCTSASLTLNGQRAEIDQPSNDGYLRISRTWSDGDIVELTLPMQVERVHPDPRVYSTHGMVAIRRGPIIFCLEEADNGGELHTLSLPEDADLTASFQKDLLGGTMVVTGKARASEADGDGEGLYGDSASERRLRDITLVPYYAWANRQAGEMRVWILEC